MAGFTFPLSVVSAPWLKLVAPHVDVFRRWRAGCLNLGNRNQRNQTQNLAVAMPDCVGLIGPIQITHFFPGCCVVERWTRGVTGVPMSRAATIVPHRTRDRRLIAVTGSYLTRFVRWIVLWWMKRSALHSPIYHCISINYYSWDIISSNQHLIFFFIHTLLYSTSAFDLIAYLIIFRKCCKSYNKKSAPEVFSTVWCKNVILFSLIRLSLFLVKER